MFTWKPIPLMQCNISPTPTLLYILFKFLFCFPLTHISGFILSTRSFHSISVHYLAYMFITFSPIRLTHLVSPYSLHMRFTIFLIFFNYYSRVACLCPFVSFHLPCNSNSCVLSCCFCNALAIAISVSLSPLCLFVETRTFIVCYLHGEKREVLMAKNYYI